MYLVYILKHLIEKAYARFFKTIFCLFNNWQEYNERKKKEQIPSQNYWPAHPRPCPCGRRCVLMCAWCLQRRLSRQCSTPTCKDSNSPGSSEKINSFELMFSLSLPLPKLFPGAHSSVWKVALHSKFSGKWKTAYSLWHPQRHLKYHLDKWAMCICVC